MTQQESIRSGHIVVDEQFFDRVLSGLYDSRSTFARELLSNAMTAIRKRELVDPDYADNQAISPAGAIDVRASRSERWIEISDNGAGIPVEDFETILARAGASATADFRAQQEGTELGADEAMRVRSMIGQFGIGLYSGFLVAGSIEVISRPFGSEEAHRWICHRNTRWEVFPARREKAGTTLRLLDVRPMNGEDFTDEDKLKELVREAAYFCPYPIRLGGQVVNQQNVPWDGAISNAELFTFYKHRYPKRSDPLSLIPVNVETTRIIARGVMYLAPGFDDLTLLVQRVPVAERVELVPPWARRFCCGVIDCPDLPLKLSREGVQPDSVELRELRTWVHRRLIRKLAELAESEPQTWETLWSQHGQQLLDAARTDPELVASVGRWFLFQSNKRGSCSLQAYLDRAGGAAEADEVVVWYVSHPRQQETHLAAFDRRDQEVLYALGPEAEMQLLALGGAFADGRPRLRFRRVDEWDGQAGQESGQPRYAPVEDEDADRLRDIIRQALRDKIADVTVAAFEPVDEPARLVRPELSDEMRQMGPMLEEMARLRAAAEQSEEARAHWESLHEDAPEGAEAAIDKMLDQVNRRRLVLNWSCPSIRAYATWALRHRTSGSTTGKNPLEVLSHHLLWIAYLGSNEPLDATTTRAAASTAADTFKLFLEFESEEP